MAFNQGVSVRTANASGGSTRHRYPSLPPERSAVNTINDHAGD